MEVEVARVDDVLPVVAAQFIKVDVKGHELAALSGMERVLASSPAARVLFEFWPSGLRAAKTEPKALLTFFAERGFTIYSIEDSRFTELTDSTLLIQKMGARRYTNLLASRTGVPTS